MKRFWLIFLLFWACNGFGQFSNSWINYSQRYFRIPITEKGVYRITYNDLLACNIKSGDFDHRNLQIVHNGKIIPLFVSAADGMAMTPTDYIEFLADDINNGWLDGKISVDGKAFNPDFSSYNDTTSYFLVIANTLESPRYDTAGNRNFASHTPLQYINKTIRTSYNATFNETEGSYIYGSESWTDVPFSAGETVQKTIIIPNIANVDAPSKVAFGIGGASKSEHSVNVSMQLADGAKIEFDTTYRNFSTIHKSFTVQKPLNSTTTINFQSIVSGNLTNNNVISYVEVTYPSKPNFNNQSFFEFTLPQISQGDTILLNITNFNGGSEQPHLYCPEINKRLNVIKNGSQYSVLIPNPHKEMQCVMVAQNYTASTPSLKPILSQHTTDRNKFVDFSKEANQGDYIIITEKRLWAQARQYKTYREQTGHKVVLVDIDELYQQFAYGIRLHPYAIVGFLDFASKTWAVKPKHVLLIGKAYHLESYRENESEYAKNTFVPSIGNPSADALYTVSLQGKDLKPKFSIGRIAAQTPQEVAIYLQKVKDFELQEPALWMKNVLLFGGGRTSNEQLTFRRYLKQYAEILKGQSFGANIRAFYKESSDVYENSEPEEIRKYMNEGTSLLCFFGHGAGTGFDQNIDHPSLFNNQGKYPLILANSCFSGDIFTSAEHTASNIWTFTPNRGSIGFLASVGYGQPLYLNQFSSAFIRNIANSNYGESIGSSIARTFTELSSRDIIYEDLYEAVVNFNLQGDPAVRLHSFTKPDLEVKPSSVFFAPGRITTDLETVDLNLVIYNNGRASNGEYSLRATFTNSSGDSFVITKQNYGYYFRDTLTYSLDVEQFSAGEYTVKIEVDFDNEIEELSEENNETTVSFFVSSRDVIPVYPPEFAIIPTDTITLQMSAVDAFRVPEMVKIEFDTCATFDSPYLMTARTLTYGEAVHSWKPLKSLEDGKTYFWRVQAEGSTNWNESSFTYEKDQSGWAQIHRQQFTNNGLVNMTYDESIGEYSFVSVPHEINLQTRGNPTKDLEYYECKFSFDATLLENSGYNLWPAVQELYIIVLDQATLLPWRSNRGSYGQRNYNYGSHYISFPSAVVANQKALASFLTDSVPDGNYILCYSFIRPNCQMWDQSLKDALTELGLSKFNDHPNDYPYIFSVQKGDKNSAEEVLGTSPDDLIYFSKELYANHSKGAIYSPIIGPAKEYNRLVWSRKHTDKDESIGLISGVDLANEFYPLENIFFAENNRLDTIVNTKFYPSMQLTCSMEDEDRTPAKLRYWKVYYTPAAEFAITPEYTYSLYNTKLQQGDTARITVSAQNLAQTESDSLLVMYELRNAEKELISLTYKRLAKVAGGSYIIDNQEFDTRKLLGDYSLRVEFNPINPETNKYDQPENEHFNNVYHINFTVEPDTQSPVIDVLFDGRHLIDGDNVAAQTSVQIRLFDNNKFLYVQDTTAFSVWTKNVETNEITYFHFSDSSAVLILDEQNPQCATVLVHTNFANGSYEFHVNARDVSGNAVASQDYQVNFVVSNEKRVSYLYNFPNPCKTFTTFRFVLAGDQVPQNMFINISDEKGRLVRSIPVNNTHIGTNELLVNLTDHEGKQLPFGIYFYSLSFDQKSDWNTLKTTQTNPLTLTRGKLLITE